MLTMEHYKAKEATKLSLRDALRAANPKLVAGDGYVVAAKNIRIELKKAFPTVKFSVRSESFSMGDAVRVSWSDGCTVAQVEKIIEKYQAGTFNSMEDIYEFKNTLWGAAFGESKYVTTSRDFSDAFILEVLATLQGTMDGEPVPSLEDYREGRTFYSPWHRTLRLALVDHSVK